MAAYAPFLTRRFDLAFQLASGLHHKQCRKGCNVPYISHLMGVCALVLEAGGDEDQAIAALLHDAVEDQGGLPTLETIRRLFGDRVADIVKGCSDSTASDPNSKLPWRQRKEAYLQHLSTAASDLVLLVSAADKLHNARAMLADYRLVGEEVWSRFTVSKSEQLWYYASLVQTLRDAGAPARLVDELGRVISELRQMAQAVAHPPVLRRWIGIDFSGDVSKWAPGCNVSNVWVAEAVENGDGLRLERLGRVQQLEGTGHPFDRLADFLSRRDFVAAAIDAPFSLPHEFIPAAGHAGLLKLVASLEREHRNPFPSGQTFADAVINGRNMDTAKPYRRTEEYWNHGGVNVRSTLWAKYRGGAEMTAACLELLSRCGCDLWPWVPEGNGLLIEAFPAAQLKTWNLPFQKYSNDDAESIENRRKIITALLRRIDLNGHESKLLGSADALDAVLCIFAALAVSNGSLHDDGLPHDDEGSIAVHM